MKNKKTLTIYLIISLLIALGTIKAVNLTIHAGKACYNFFQDPVGIDMTIAIVNVPRKKAIVKDYQTLLETDVKFKEYVNNIDVKRNNPGNLRFAGQPNAINDNGFAKFPNIQIGFRALIMQIKADQGRELTLEQFITKYSPPCENDTPHLIRRAEELTSENRTHKINNIDTVFLAKVMANQEFSIKF